MPFDSTTSIVNAGDVIYGLKGPRKKIRAKEPFKSKAFIIDDLYVLKMELLIEKPKYAAEQASFQTYLREHETYHTAVGGEGNEAERRKCKGGVGWAISTRRQVHFFLDQLDIYDVIGKTNPNSTFSGQAPVVEDPEDRAITGAELRWVYRNRYMPEVQKGVQFYVNGNACKAPWLEDVVIYDVTFRKDRWLGYVPNEEPRPPTTAHQHPASIGNAQPIHPSSYRSDSINPASITG